MVKDALVRVARLIGDALVRVIGFAVMVCVIFMVGFGILHLPVWEGPRLTITGGTPAEQSLLQARLDHYNVKVPKGTRITISNTLSEPHSVGTAKRVTPVDLRNGRVCPGCTDIAILESVFSMGNDYIDAVVIHEVGHAVQFQTAGRVPGEDIRMAYQGNAETRDFEIEADCLVESVAGIKIALRHGSYLEKWHQTCSAAQLEDARQMWASVS